MLLWQGACIVHDEFKANELAKLQQQHPDAAVLVHPESPEDVVALADVVGSTSALINAVKTLPNDKFIVATDNGIFYKMKLAAPGKTLIEAPTGGISATCNSCAHCAWMAMNSLHNLSETLEQGNNEIHVDESIRKQAFKSVNRMIEFANK